MGEINRIIHAPARLRIMASLVAVHEDEEVDFAYLRDLLGLTDGNLGAHLGKLEDAGYTHVEKTFVKRKPRTFLSATKKGREAFREYVRDVEKIFRGETGAPETMAD